MARHKTSAFAPESDYSGATTQFREGVEIEVVSSLKREIGLRFTIMARLMRNNFDRQVAGLNVTRSQCGR